MSITPNQLLKELDNIPLIKNATEVYKKYQKHQLKLVISGGVIGLLSGIVSLILWLNSVTFLTPSYALTWMMCCFLGLPLWSCFSMWFFKNTGDYLFKHFSKKARETNAAYHDTITEMTKLLEMDKRFQHQIYSFIDKLLSNFPVSHDVLTEKNQMIDALTKKNTLFIISRLESYKVYLQNIKELKYELPKEEDHITQFKEDHIQYKNSDLAQYDKEMSVGELKRYI